MKTTKWRIDPVLRRRGVCPGSGRRAEDKNEACPVCRSQVIVTRQGRVPHHTNGDDEVIWDVTRNTKAIRYGLDSQEDALRVVKRHRKYQVGDLILVDGRKVK